jgi:DNA-binding transcriptional LysR family regulator
VASWSEADLKMLRDLAAQPGADLDTICATMRRTESAIKIQLVRLKIRLRAPRPPMTANEIAIVKSMARAGHGIETISTALHRANATIRYAATKHNIEIKTPRGGGSIAVAVGQNTLLALRHAAAQRNTTAVALCAALVERIAARDMFGVVLDSRDLPTITSRAAMPAEV